MDSREPSIAIYSHRSSSRNETATFEDEPRYYGFFDSSPEARNARQTYLKIVLPGSLSVIIIIFALLPIYWGALWKTNVHYHNIHAWVVDFDQGPVGNAIISGIQALQPSPDRLTWVVKNASEFPGGPAEVANRVHNEDAWMAVTVNPGASNALASAITSPQQNSNYNGSSAITAYAEEARSENAFRGVLRPQLEAVMQPIVIQFTAQLIARNISALPQDQVSDILQSTPQVLTRPIYYTLNNMRPFDVPVATAVTFVGLIYLLILAFQVTMISAAARQASGIDANLDIKHLLLLRIVTPFVIYFFLSAFYSLLSYAFQAPFDRYFGSSGFVIYWVLQWFGMLALGLAMEAMITLLTQRFISIFLILWIIVNVSVCFFPIELLPGVFRYGYATPFLNVSQGVRAILFGVKNKLGLNFGILIAWTALSCGTIVLFTLLTRRQSIRQPPAVVRDKEGHY